MGNKSKLELPKGTRDLLPEEMILKQEIVDTLKETFEEYGFSPLDTPNFEKFDVLSSKYAGGAEILKETFKFKDQGNRELGLRYDLTVPLARVIGMNPNMKMPFKRYHVGAVYRDGPVEKARYRQFTQCDVDIVGCSKMTADAEIIAVSDAFFKKIGLKARIKVNNRKILGSILEKAGVKENLKDGAMLSIDKLEKFGEQAVRKELSDKGVSKEQADDVFKIIGIKGTNSEKIEKLKKEIPGSEGIEEIEKLFKYLDAMNVKVDFDVSLARGLSYYTGMITETVLVDSKVKSSVVGGGRWDNMIGDFLGKEKGAYPAVGYSFGVDRIYDALLEKRKQGKKTVAELYIIPIGTTSESLGIAKKLRDKGVKVDIDIMKRGISKNLNYANTMGIAFVGFVGEEELKQKKIKLKNMNSGDEKLVSVDEVVNIIKK